MSLNVVNEIKLDHDNIRALLAQFKTASGADKIAIGNTIIREALIHGDAEEKSVYAALPGLGLGDTAAHNTEEHAEIKVLIAEAAAAGGDAAVLQRAADLFIAHATEEETDLLPLLAQKLTPEQSNKLAKEFIAARKAPAAGSESAKILSSIAGAPFVELKQTHGVA